MKKLQTSKGFTPLNPEEKQEFCQKQNYLTGFTLVEMIVSLGLFTVILFISMQALLSMVDANHKAQSLRAAMDNLNLSLEE
ncbi:type II secretion system GspH family protein, partial [Patescibacteria group bacterium]|nr:type II secretion system GspH family protein [Patescibacteria group bacterium]MBU1956621.1 type II secretion system GspH family protein [Patescibacteria group bacterium]